MIIPVLAIDPGSAGSAAVAVIDGHGRLHVRWGFDNLRELGRAIAGFVQQVEPVRQAIEFVHAMPGQGVTSMFTFGRGTGVGFGALFALRPDVPVYEVTPQKWQGWYRVVGDTAPVDSTQHAPNIFTPDELQQCRQPRGKLNHNACDAALLAYWLANQLDEALKVSEHWREVLKKRKPSKAALRGNSS